MNIGGTVSQARWNQVYPERKDTIKQDLSVATSTAVCSSIQVK